MANREIYEELRKDFRKKNKGFGKYEIFGLILLFICLIPFLVLALMKSHEYIESFDDIWEPIQTPTTWWVTLNVDGEIVNVSFLAEYDIKWRVLAVAQYWDNIFERMFGSAYREDNIIRYKDVWIWWWFLTQDEYVNRFNRMSLSRFLLPEPKSYEDWLYVTDRYSREDINSHMSHNHLIPANGRIQKLLRWINKGQYIHIKWYLVSLNWNNWYHLVSSLTREDQGDGACETIYVTDVARLRER